MRDVFLFYQQLEIVFLIHILDRSHSRSKKKKSDDFCLVNKIISSLVRKMQYNATSILHNVLYITIHYV